MPRNIQADKVASKDNTYDFSEKNSSSWFGRTVIDPKRTPLPPAKWYQKAKSMQMLGKIFSSTSIVGAATGVAILFSGSTASIVTGGLIIPIALTLLIPGIYLIKKAYWHDQKYVDRVAIEVDTKSFHQIIGKYNWTLSCKNLFISNQKLAAKFIQQIESDDLNYLSVVKLYGDKIRKFGFIEWKELRPMLMKEIEEEGLTLESFKEKYGKQPLVDGVFGKDDPWYKAEAARVIVGKTYEQMQKEFALEIEKGVITPEMMRNELLNQYSQQPSFEAFMQQQGGNKTFWTIFTDKILGPEMFSAVVAKQTENMTAHQFVHTFSWAIFKAKITSGSLLQERFAREELDKPLSVILNRFGGWKIVHYGLVEAHQLKNNALSEIDSKNLHFKQILKDHGWEAFTLGVISGEDIAVRQSFLKWAEQTEFCEIMERCGNGVFKYQLFPQSHLETIHALAKEKSLVQEEHAAEIKKHEELYDNAVQRAESEKDLATKIARRNVTDVEDAISEENRYYHSPHLYLDHRRGYRHRNRSFTYLERYQRHIHRLEKLESQLRREQSFLVQAKSLAQAAYRETCQEAAYIRDQRMNDAKRSLQDRKEMINKKYKYFIRTSKI